MTNTTSTAKYAAAATQILAAADKAATQFTGIDWESGPQQLVDALEAKRAVDEDDLAGAFWDDDGSHDAQRLTAQWRSLLADLPTGDHDDLCARAHEMAAAESDAVEASAKSAAELGRSAAELVGAGKWDDAIDAARSAAAIERAYGDALAWGGLEDAIRALPEYQAMTTARVVYLENEADDEAIAAGNTEHAAVEQCGEVISAVGESKLGITDKTREDWSARFTATYVAEIADWCAA